MAARTSSFSVQFFSISICALCFTFINQFFSSSLSALLLCFAAQFLCTFCYNIELLCMQNIAMGIAHCMISILFLIFEIRCENEKWDVMVARTDGWLQVICISVKSSPKLWTRTLHSYSFVTRNKRHFAKSNCIVPWPEKLCHWWKMKRNLKQSNWYWHAWLLFCFKWSIKLHELNSSFCEYCEEHF